MRDIFVACGALFTRDFHVQIGCLVEQGRREVHVHRDRLPELGMLAFGQFRAVALGQAVEKLLGGCIPIQVQCLELLVGDGVPDGRLRGQVHCRQAEQQGEKAEESRPHDSLRMSFALSNHGHLSRLR